jgi:galactan 5-O-arabinofuranosyltransferase
VQSVRNGVSTAAQTVLASAVAVVVSVVGLSAISTVEWPAFPSSN